VSLATVSFATAPEIGRVPKSVSRNFSGTAELSLKMLDPSGFTGCWTPLDM
jgi:hypothetical protein